MRVLWLMIAAQISAMLGTSALAAVLPALITAWHLSAAEAGWMSGSYFAGYALAVPFLVGLTDRIDARRVFAGGCAVGAVAGFGFASFANGIALGTLFWTLAGVSTAGVYMPGLRVVIDRLEPAARLRAVPYYTASFGMGIAVSFFVAGSVAALGGWRAAFVAGGAGCVVAVVLLAAATAGTGARVPAGRRGSFALRAVLANGAAMRYVVAYGGHCWELFALRAWLVALLLFMWKTGGGAGDSARALTAWSAFIALVGVPASIAGAELALRLGRRRVVVAVAAASVAGAFATAWSATASFTAGAMMLVLYNALVLGDSGAITAGVVDAAAPDVQGATLALHSLVGFVGGALGPIAVGYALTAGGGASGARAWTFALATMAAGSLVATAAVRYAAPKRALTRGG